MLPLGMYGNTEASTTRSPLVPRTSIVAGSVTDSSSVPLRAAHGRLRGAPPCGAGGMEGRLGVAGDPFQDLGVGRDARSRRDLAVVERFECGLADDVPPDLRRLDPFAPVLVGRQVIEAERGVLRRIGAPDADRAACVRVHRPD